MSDSDDYKTYHDTLPPLGPYNDKKYDPKKYDSLRFSQERQTYSPVNYHSSSNTNRYFSSQFPPSHSHHHNDRMTNHSNPPPHYPSTRSGNKRLSNYKESRYHPDRYDYDPIRYPSDTRYIDPHLIDQRFNENRSHDHYRYQPDSSYEPYHTPSPTKRTNPRPQPPPLPQNNQSDTIHTTSSSISLKMRSSYSEPLLNTSNSSHFHSISSKGCYYSSNSPPHHPLKPNSGSIFQDSSTESMYETHLPTHPNPTNTPIHTSKHHTNTITHAVSAPNLLSTHPKPSVVNTVHETDQVTLIRSFRFIFEKLRPVKVQFNDETQRPFSSALESVLNDLNQLIQMENETITNPRRSKIQPSSIHFYKGYHQYQEADRNIRIIEGDLNEVEQQIQALETTSQLIKVPSSSEDLDIQDNRKDGSGETGEIAASTGFWPDSNWTFPNCQDYIKGPFMINYNKIREDDDDDDGGMIISI